MKDYIIIMADIIDSGKKNQKKLMVNFKRVINEVNSLNSDLLLSPMTITLGDEFQGVAKNIESAINLLFLIQEKIIKYKANFKLRYVIVEGSIATPLNRKIAHGMLGEGLTNARKLLETSKDEAKNYQIELKDKNKSQALVNALFLYQSIVDSWEMNKDEELIGTFIALDDYKLVAEKLDKTRSLMWKRRKSLRIDEYIAAKATINYIAT